MDVYSSEWILSINYAGDLFSNDINKMKEEYKMLAKIWHPDICSDDMAGKVFAMINDLYDNAKHLFLLGIWEKSNYLKLLSKDNELIDINYLTTKEFELGKIYICDNHIVYLFYKKNKSFYDNSLRQIKNLNYADLKMKEEFSKFVPHMNKSFETDDYFGLVIEKNEDDFMLRDIVNYFDKSMPDRHVAWIMSRLLNLVCYLDYSRLSHNGINIDNCIISPDKHTISLLGGWWYCVKQNEKMIGTTKEIFEIMPILVKNSKLGDISTDLEAVKLIGRQLLGDKSGIKIKKENKIPTPFMEWLMNGVGSDGFDEFKKWNEVLYKSYGKRKFVEMNISKNDIYSTKNN